MKKWPNFNWYLQPGVIRGDLKKVMWEENLARGKFDNFGEALGILVDMMLLAEGDVFVGKFTSSVDRLVLNLLSYRKRGLVPFKSLDAPWCADWAQLVGRTKLGFFNC